MLLIVIKQIVFLFCEWLPILRSFVLISHFVQLSENISLNLLYLLLKDGTLGDLNYYNMVQVVLFCNNFSQIKKEDIFFSSVLIE